MSEIPLLSVLQKGRSNVSAWRYVQPESATTFTGHSYYEVESKVHKHRLAMGYDTDKGWQQRFEDDLCKQNLTVDCKGRGKKKVDGISISDLKRFLSSMLNWNGTFVEQDEANRRGAICATCPLQTAVPGCFGCAGVGKLLRRLLKGRTTPNDGALT